MRVLSFATALAAASLVNTTSALRSKEWLLQHCDRCSPESIDALDADDVDRIMKAVKLPADVTQLDSTAAANAAKSMSDTILKLLDEASNLDTLQMKQCFNNCSAGNGACGADGTDDVGLCTCNAGFGGLDCAHDANGKQHPNEAPEAYIFVYDMPPELGLRNMRKTLGDSLYWAEAVFLQNLLSDWSVRTTDPSKAKLFYVPTMFYYSVNNVALFDKEQLEKIKPHLAQWERNNGTDHVFYLTNDKGACGSEEGPIFITHFGLTVPWNAMGKEASYNKTAEEPGPLAQRDCADENAIVTPPFGTSAGTKDLQTAREAKKAQPRNEAGVLQYKYEVSFAGGMRFDRCETHDENYNGSVAEAVCQYSQGVRQRMYDHFRDNPRYAIEEGSQPVEVFGESRFCLAPTGDGWGVRLSKAMILGCVPLIIQPKVRQPFDELLPYEKFAVTLDISDIPKLDEILGRITPEQHSKLLEGVEKYAADFYHDGQDFGRHAKGRIYGNTIAMLAMRAAPFGGSVSAPVLLPADPSAPPATAFGVSGRLGLAQEAAASARRDAEAARKEVAAVKSALDAARREAEAAKAEAAILRRRDEDPHTRMETLRRWGRHEHARVHSEHALVATGEHSWGASRMM